MRRDDALGPSLVSRVFPVTSGPVDEGLLRQDLLCITEVLDTSGPRRESVRMPAAPNSSTLRSYLGDL